MKRLALGLLATGCAGCVMAPTQHFTLISTKPTSQEQLAHALEATNTVHGRDTEHVIVFIPTGQIRVDQAIDDALKNAPGAIALKDVSVETRMLFGIFYYYASFWVDGRPLMLPEHASTANDMTPSNQALEGTASPRRPR